MVLFLCTQVSRFVGWEGSLLAKQFKMSCEPTAYSTKTSFPRASRYRSIAPQVKYRFRRYID